MFSLFKRRAPEPPAELTFKARVDRFWKWYASVAAQNYQTIEDRRCGDLTEETRAQVNALVPGLGWVYGPGADETGHSLTLTGEGNAHRQFLAEYWRLQAPKIEGWTFYSSRQAKDGPGMWTIEMAGLSFDPKAFWLAPTVNEEDRRIDLVVWHPLFPQMEEKARWTVLFLFLDEALGEIGTQNWIGEIDMNDTSLATALPLAELPTYVEGVRAEYGWEKGEPRDSWATYSFEGDPLDQPRGDIFVGSTNARRLLNEFGSADGQLADPLAETGADYIYVQFDAAILPRGQETDKRWEFEEALIAALDASASGWHLGGAIGRQSAYIDLMIFDGATSMAVVQDTLRRLKLPKGSSINYFAHEKRGHRLLI